MEFGVLGPLEVTAHGQPLLVRGARTRAVLAMLLMHANQVVAADQLIEELWPGQPADRASASLQVRVSELRKALRSAQEAERLVTRPPGYLIRVAPGELDALRFDRLARDGETALATGDAGLAARRLAEALSLWRGPALADMDAAPFARAEAARLEEGRITALESHAEALLACGRHRELIGDLETLTTAYPLRERLWSQRMLALYRAGRQADALRAYRDLRAILVNELGIEPGPALRDLEGRILRQDPALAPPAGRGAPSKTEAPPTRYAQSGDGVHIAYQVLGEGELDIVAVPGLISHLDLWWEVPASARFFRRLASLGRLIMFDKRDTGLSDRAGGEDTLEQRIDDVRAVMRACRSDQAVLFGYSEGGPMSILFAATYPERVTALILGAATARSTAAPDYPCGQQTGEAATALEELAAHHWGRGDSIEWYAPSVAGSSRAREAMARWERMAASPSAVLRMIRMIRAIDVRGILSGISVPALIIQRRNDRIHPPCHGRYLAEHLPDARYFEQPGDHLLWLGDTDAMFAQIQEFLAAAKDTPGPRRVLATILHAEILPNAPDATTAAERHVVAFRGRLVTSANGAVIATFDGPARAIRCAAAVRRSAADLGLAPRFGIHTGEVELAGDDVTGISVRRAAEVAALARQGEILVSRTVSDLVAGSEIAFAYRGSHQLTGISEPWPVFAVTGA